MSNIKMVSIIVMLLILSSGVHAMELLGEQEAAELKQPVSMVSPDGTELYITDHQSNCYHKYVFDSENNKLTHSWCRKGGSFKWTGKLNKPCGIIFYNGFLYVADSNNKRVVRCDLNGDCTAFRKYGAVVLNSYPLSICSDEGIIYSVGLNGPDLSFNREDEEFYTKKVYVKRGEQVEGYSCKRLDGELYFIMTKYVPNNNQVEFSEGNGILKLEEREEGYSIVNYKKTNNLNFKYKNSRFWGIDEIPLKENEVIIDVAFLKDNKVVYLVWNMENGNVKFKVYSLNEEDNGETKPSEENNQQDDKTEENGGEENKNKDTDGSVKGGEGGGVVERSSGETTNQVEKSDCAASPNGEPGCKTAPCGKCSVLNVPYRCKCRVSSSEGKRVKSCVGVFDEGCCLKGFKYLTKDINGKEISACFPEEAESKDDFDGKKCYENGGRCLNGTFFKNENYGHFKSLNHKCPSGTVCLVEKAENELQENEKCGHKGEKCCLNGCYQGLTCCKSKNYEEGVCLQTCTLGQGAEEVVGCCVTAEGCTTIYNENTTSCNTNNSNNKFVEKESCDSVELCTNGCCVIATKDSITHFVGSKYKCELTSSKITSSDGQKYTYIFNKSITKKEECDGLSNKFQASDFYRAFGFKATINAENALLTYNKESQEFKVCTDGFYKLSKEENANEISVSLDYTLNGNCNKVKVSLGDQEAELEKTEEYKSITLSYNKDNSNDVDKVKMSITLNTPASDTTNSEYCCLNVKNLKIESSNKSG